MLYRCHPKGVCSREFLLDIDSDGTIRSAEVIGGCMGNLRGLTSLMIGQNAQEIASKLEGIDCGGKGTSCPDQISRALRAILTKRNNEQI